MFSKLEAENQVVSSATIGAKQVFQAEENEFFLTRMKSKMFMKLRALEVDVVQWVGCTYGKKRIMNMTDGRNRIKMNEWMRS